MKELINNLIKRSGLSNKEFAIAVGTSGVRLSQQKQCRHINYELLISWAKTFDFETIESEIITIKVKNYDCKNKNKKRRE